MPKMHLNTFGGRLPGPAGGAYTLPQTMRGLFLRKGGRDGPAYKGSETTSNRDGRGGEKGAGRGRKGRGREFPQSLRE